MQAEKHYPAEAILFFGEGEIVKQMLYSEFQAVLDGYVPLVDLASERMQAAYVRIHESFSITHAVFFGIDIDSQGFIDRDWNIPFNHLLDRSEFGPDLGAGPIRLVCESQCPVSWHKENLWEPDLSPSGEFVKMVKKAIKQNRLGLIFDTIAEKSTAPDPDELDHRKHQQMSDLLRRYRDRVEELNLDAKHTIEKLSTDHSEYVQELKQKIELQQKELLEQQYANDRLNEIIDGQADKIVGLREYFEHKIKSVKCDEQAELQALKENYLQEMEDRVEQATASLREQLQIKEIEILYRNERESNLHEQVIRLQLENKALLQGSGDKILDQLSAAGINFVAYHPGAGHMNISLMDMPEYLDNPTAYVAKKCNVTEEHYSQWLVHYHAPVCHYHEGNSMCGELISRINHPEEFVAGKGDRCSKHQVHQRPVLKVYK